MDTVYYCPHCDQEFGSATKIEKHLSGKDDRTNKQCIALEQLDAERNRGVSAAAATSIEVHNINNTTSRNRFCGPVQLMQDEDMGQSQGNLPFDDNNELFGVGDSVDSTSLMIDEDPSNSHRRVDSSQLNVSRTEAISSNSASEKPSKPPLDEEDKQESEASKPDMQNLYDNDQLAVTGNSTDDSDQESLSGGAVLGDCIPTRRISQRILNMAGIGQGVLGQQESPLQVQGQPQVVGTVAESTENAQRNTNEPGTSQGTETLGYGERILKDFLSNKTKYKDALSSMDGQTKSLLELVQLLNEARAPLYLFEKIQK